MRRIVSGDQGQSRYVEGGCSIFQTTANPEINPETKSRFFILGVDESREQTRRILAMQRKSHTLEGLEDQSDKEGIILLPAPVGTLCRRESLRRRALLRRRPLLLARRDEPKFLNLCKAVAFLNQMKKNLKNYNGIDYIEVSREEIQQATELTSELLGISLDDLSLPARNLLQLLLEMNRKTFSRKEVMDYTDWTKTCLRLHLTELIKMELVLPESQKKNQFQTYKLLYTGEGQDGKRFMLGLHGVQ